jgi:D-alanine-D-alanine ligase
MKIALTYDTQPVSAVAMTTAAADDSNTAWEAPVAMVELQEALTAEHEVALIENNDSLEDRMLAVWPDLVLHLSDGLGRSEREMPLPALLESWHIPFCGSSARSLRVCRDTAAMKRTLRKKGLPTPVFSILETPDDVYDLARFPVRVKPLYEPPSGAGEAEVLAYTRHELRAQVRMILETYDQPALVETFLPGREFTIALLGNGPHVTILPVVEHGVAALSTDPGAMTAAVDAGVLQPGEPRCDRVYYPAVIAAELEQAMADMARQAFLTLECSDFCSVHIRLDDVEQPYILDMNPMPGLLPYPECPSAFLQAAAAARMAYPDLICRILQLTCQRYGLGR